MKKILTLCLLLSGFTGLAHKDHHCHAPTSVRMAFSKQFPGIHDARWEQENGKYEAHFKYRGQQTSALFDDKGTWIETERSISIEALPPAATLYIENNFSGKIARTASVVTQSGGDISYEAHLKGADYVFDANGKFIRVEKD